MIRDLLPECVSGVDSREDVTAAGTLYPQEEAVIQAAVEKRRREFTTVRACARQAMAALGLAPAPVLPGPRGEPQWPAGVVGSMTHCLGYRAAALARTTHVRSLGIDAEPAEPLPDGVLEAVALPAEQSELAAAHAADAQVPWDRLLFSAKESVYKTWFPLAHRMLDFSEARLSFHRTPGDATGGTFTARLLAHAPTVPAVFEGRWLVSDGIVLTAIVLPAGD
ncbi:4'-phosphopantetheinyl transferase EntD [Kitasatospora sp. GP30]|uniref:4'-phosphopantetheinyl transferase family protein n=1 Tax=Kitasatospora sp. GP30 TaxID=3035084 RepID=UPI000C70788A|nr:4'-phosphopantetheinyl transferase superfamily protein [Kitasatospora sp. GP30]MDH6145474.1 4'-phosphopantetheinyl transferase EntD [Kitasatospora sp. GP30]